MNDDLLIRRITASLDVAPPDPSLRARVTSSLPLDRRRARRKSNWAPAIAAGVAVAVIAGMMAIGYFRSGLGGSQPASHPQVPLSECRLPVYGFGIYQAGQQSDYEVGFLDLSTQVFTQAASSTTGPVDHLRISSTNEPVQIAYDRPAGIWLPVKSEWIANDGLSYVYMSGSDLHLKDVGTGADRTLLKSGVVRLLGWSNGKVYYSTGGGYSVGLAEVDPRTGKSHDFSVAQLSEWWIASPNAIWGSAYYSGQLTRYDTSTGTFSTWTLDRLVDIIGVDSSGHPVVLQRAEGTDQSTTSGQVMIMRASGDADPIGGKDDILSVENLTVIADGDRIWFSGTGQRIWLYSPTTGLLLLDQSANASLPNGLVVAGGCV